MSYPRAPSYKLVAMNNANRELDGVVDSRVAADSRDARDGPSSGREKRKQLRNVATPPQDRFSSRSSTPSPFKRPRLSTSACTQSDDPVSLQR